MKLAILISLIGILLALYLVERPVYTKPIVEPTFFLAGTSEFTIQYPCDYSYREIPDKQWTISTINIAERIRCGECHEGEY